MSICTFFVTLALNRKVGGDCPESTRRAAERVAAGIEAARLVAQEKWGDTINRIKNGRK